jgi:hypothetical protein
MFSATGALLASQKGDAVLLILGVIFVPAGAFLLWGAITDPGGWFTAWHEGNKDYKVGPWRPFVSTSQFRTFVGLIGTMAAITGAAALAVFFRSSSRQPPLVVPPNSDNALRDPPLRCGSKIVSGVPAGSTCLAH